MSYITPDDDRMALATYITSDDADDEMLDDDGMALAGYITPDDEHHSG